MSSASRWTFLFATISLIGVLGFAGCSRFAADENKIPVFILAWSEYPSWCLFGAANELGMLAKEEAKFGELEKAWGIDIVLKKADYETCMRMYRNGEVDAVCTTNIDAIGLINRLDSVVLFPTSSSVGADTCVALDVADVSALKGLDIPNAAGASLSYLMDKEGAEKGLAATDYRVVSSNGEQAVHHLMSGENIPRAALLREPKSGNFLDLSPKAKVLFDSTQMPDQIIDLVAVSRVSMHRRGANDFVNAIMEAFYGVARRMENDDQDALHAVDNALGGYGVARTQVAFSKAKLYSMPQSAIDLFTGTKFQEETTPAVVKYCVEHKLLELAEGKEVSLGFDDKNKSLNFSSEYLKAYVIMAHK